MNEQLFLGECPIIRPEGIYYGGRRVIRLGMSGVGVGDVGDLLAYRQKWEPFILAHLEQWTKLNELFESIPSAQKCPPGIFGAAQIAHLPPAERSFCASLALTRIRISLDDPGGIRKQWNAWQGRPSADLVEGAPAMLSWLQEVVLRVGGPYKEELTELAKLWDVTVDLPDLPTFSEQQDLIARIQGAYITTKGVLQIVGYGIAKNLELASDATRAVAQGLTATAKQLPTIVPKVWTAFAIAAAVVAGGLVIYYVPRQTRRRSET